MRKFSLCCYLSWEILITTAGLFLSTCQKCRPLLHAQVAYGVKATRGIESDPIKCMKACAFLKMVLERMNEQGQLPTGAYTLPQVLCEDVEKVGAL